MTLKEITRYTQNGRTFIICEDNEKRFWAFEDMYIIHGRLTKEFNGITGKMSKTVEETIDRVRQQILFDAYIAAGFPKDEALLKVFCET